MKKLYLCALWSLCLTTMPLPAQQSAANVMNKMIRLLQNNAIRTNFGLVIKAPGDSQMEKVGGSFIMQGNKFVFSTNNMQVYFDGKTQWAYMPTLNEVSISTPSEQELAQTNPLALIQTYYAKSTAKLIRSNNAKQTYNVELTPKETEADIRKIQIAINKSNHHPRSIQLVDKNGVVSVLSLVKFQVGAKTTPDTFVFNSSVYKDIEINDLR